MNGIFGTTFSRGWDRHGINDSSWLQALIDVETALLRAAEATGAAPEGTSDAIIRHWEVLPLSADKIGADAAAGGNPVIPLVAALKDAVPADLRAYVHFGATSQDVMDTAMLLLTRRSLTVLNGELQACADAAADLARRHGDVELPGRTLLQDAHPISFGFKAATWMYGLDGARRRLATVSGVLPVQYGGPVGTFGNSEVGPLIRRHLARQLDLVEPEIAWHTVRLPIADLAGALGAAAGVIGKIALDVTLLAQTAVGEVREGHIPGEASRGGSSSMPHKHNPIAAISARACTIRTPGLVATLYAAMAQEHERAAGAWHSEWETLSDLLRLNGSAAAWLADSLQHLIVDAEAMTAHRRGLPGAAGESAMLTAAAISWHFDGGHADGANQSASGAGGS